MYTLLRENAAPSADASGGIRRRWALRRIDRNVLFLGLTSLFTDISSEMVATVLPLYFIVYLHFTPLTFGIVDGLYQGSAALVRVASGFAADRWRLHKQIAAVGYATSAGCKLGLLAAGNAWGAVSATIVADRAGKGLRTAPRDALISLSSTRDMLGTAFGVHRALDTIGALIGPLLAFWILTQAPEAFDAVFVVSFFIALIGLAILLLFVDGRPGRLASAAAHRVSLRGAGRLFVDRRFLTLVIAGGALSLLTISDGFLYLMLQRRLDFNLGLFPLLYVGTSLTYIVLAVPAGALADRIGRGKVFLGGYLLLILVYSALLRPSVGAWEVLAYVGLLGAYYAATDGVLMALASSLVPAELRTSGLGALTAVISIGRLFGSLLVGALWTWRGADQAVGVLLVGLAITVLLAAPMLIRAEGRDVREQPAA